MGVGWVGVCCWWVLFVLDVWCFGVLCLVLIYCLGFVWVWVVLLWVGLFGFGVGLFCRFVVGGWRFVVFVVDGFCFVVLLFVCGLFCCLFCLLVVMVGYVDVMYIDVDITDCCWFGWVCVVLCVLFYLGEFVMVVYLLLLVGCFVFWGFGLVLGFGFCFGFIVFRCFVGCRFLV